jgi:PepSY-associated TM region
MTADSISVADRPVGGRLYAMLWRWHFLAALIVIPFVLWQSTTGSLYLWSEWWMDQRYPELRFVAPSAESVPVSAQVAAALALAPRSFDAKAAVSGHSHGAPAAAPPSGAAAAHGPPVQEIILPSDPRRSTIVVLHDESGLAYATFVDPRDARVLGSLTAAQWIPGVTRALHGGWPLGKAGSWLLELGDGWAIFMIGSGLYLWWPRGRGVVAALWPRFDRGPRILMRDLHASVAVLFSVVFLFFLISALPWTAFWGGEVLSRIQTVLGQNSPAGFSPGGASVAQMTTVLRPIDEIAAQARTRDVAGTLVIRLAPWPGAPLYLMNKDNLCLPKTTSGNIYGEARPGWAEQRAGRAVAPVDGAANLSPGTDAFGVRCSIRRSRQGSGADGPRRRRRCDRGIPGGSSRSVSPHARSARVTAGPSGDRVCPWLQDAS